MSYGHPLAREIEGLVIKLQALWSVGGMSKKAEPQSNAIVQAAIALLRAWALSVEQDYEDLSTEGVEWYRHATNEMETAIRKLADGVDVEKNQALLQLYVDTSHKINWG